MAKILVLDIESRPYEAYIWNPKVEYVPHGQLKEERLILSFAAKWVGEKKIFYMDQRRGNDKKILEALCYLLGKADAILTKNGKRFDQRVIFGRMALMGMKPPKPFQHIDVEQLFRKHFDLPYYNLDYLSKRFCKKHKKSKHGKFPGFELWRGCLEGKLAAWNELKLYNLADIRATEELFHIVQPWGIGADLNVFNNDPLPRCNCGSEKLVKRGFSHTKIARYQQYRCLDCGAWSRGAKNLLPKAKKDSLKR